jgi:glyoxylase-like metal-dependent hydrolase (beta-lactamase superfamily II)
MERRTVGNVEVIALADMQQAYPATAVFPGAGAALDRFAAYIDAEGKILLNFAAFLLIDGSRRILVDTGWGPEFSGQLPDELAACGVAASAVDTVIFTHLHGDHTGWNFDRATSRPYFPNARYLVPKGDFDHYSAQTPPPASFTRDIAPLAKTGQLELIEGEVSLTPSLTTLPTPGHTPGHTSVMIASGREHGCVLGDVVVTRIDAEEPALDMSFDWDHAIARRTRESLVARLAQERALVGASHLPAPGFGHFAVRGGRSRWDPAPPP